MFLFFLLEAFPLVTQQKTWNNGSAGHGTHYHRTINLCIASLVVMHHFCALILSCDSTAYVYFPKALQYRTRKSDFILEGKKEWELLSG